MDSKLRLLLLEFTGVAQSYPLREILSHIDGACVESIDPIGFGNNGNLTNAGRALLICDEIKAARNVPVVIVAWCAGSALAGPLATQLRAAGVDVPAVLLLDPITVSDTVLGGCPL